MKGLSNILRILVTGSFAMLLQACYGVVASMESYGYTHLKAVDSNGKAIPELKVSYKNISYAENWEAIGYTDELGEVEIDKQIYLNSNTNLKFEDVDGKENLGDFEAKTLTSKDITNNTVKMNLK